MKGEISVMMLIKFNWLITSIMTSFFEPWFHLRYSTNFSEDLCILIKYLFNYF